MGVTEALPRGRRLNPDLLAGSGSQESTRARGPGHGAEEVSTAKPAEAEAGRGPMCVHWEATPTAHPESRLDSRTFWGEWDARVQRSHLGRRLAGQPATQFGGMTSRPLSRDPWGLLLILWAPHPALRAHRPDFPLCFFTSSSRLPSEEDGKVLAHFTDAETDSERSKLIHQPWGCGRDLASSPSVQQGPPPIRHSPRCQGPHGIRYGEGGRW